MLARGSLGNPWLFERLLGLREGEPTRQEVADELRWVIARAEEHLGTERAGRYLRKFYPWYGETMGLPKLLNQELCTAPTTARAGRARSAHGLARGCRRRLTGALEPMSSGLSRLLQWRVPKADYKG